MMQARRRGREAALQILFFADAAEVDAKRGSLLYWRYLSQSDAGEAFAGSLIEVFLQQSERIDEIIAGASDHWRLERMASVDRNILRLAVAELIGLADIPKRVTLNEAIELAKRFGTENSASFVNGVLDRIAAELGKA